MGSNVTVTNAAKALQILYSDKKVLELAYAESPLLALLPKNPNFVGSSYKFAITYGRGTGVSRTFATAKANKGPGKYENFTLTRKKDYGFVSIETEAILATEGKKAAFLDLAKTEHDGVIQGVARNQSVSLYRNTGGARGQVASTSSGTLTLTNRTDAVNFEVGMVLKCASTDGTSGSVDAASAVTITGVNRREGKLLAAAWTGFSDNYYLFREGDFGASITGLDMWIPASAPSVSESFNGVDRSVDSRLYGISYDGTGLAMDEAIQDCEAQLHAEGGKPDFLFLNPQDTNTLRKSLGTQVVRDVVKSPDMASVSFSTIMFQGLGNKPIKVVSDKDCPINTGYLLQMDTWEYLTMGGAPRILEVMGHRYQFDTDNDAIEARVVCFSELGCRAPGWNARVKFR